MGGTGDLALSCNRCREHVRVPSFDGTVVMAATTALFSEDHRECLAVRGPGGQTEAGERATGC